MSKQNKKAIVTLTVGKQYEDIFNLTCRTNWSEYARRFDYDLIVLRDHLDHTERARKRSPAWQKLLILSQDWSKQYEQIVWIDTDILINNQDPADVSKSVPVEKVGAVEQYSIPTREIYNIALRRQYQIWKNSGIPYIDNLTPDLFYKNRGIPSTEMNAVVQTGVFVCSTVHHRSLFEHIYYSYEDTHGSEWNYEMPAMSYELLKDDCVTWISNRFNYCVSDVLAAFYPNLLSNEQKLANRIKSKLLSQLRLPPTLSTELLAAIKNIHDLSVFTHFASCSRFMMPFHSYLQHRL